jgi:predicted esterase
MLEEMRAHQKLQPSDIRVVGKEVQDGIENQFVVIQTPFGYRRVVDIYRPEQEGSYAAILYVHWFESKSPDSNRTQFIEEAQEIARGGAICFLVETLWSDMDFFYKRTQADDMQNSIQEVINLRRFIDLLLEQPGIDSKRFAYVGHDFGGMYGVLAGSLDQRPSHYIIMASTPRFSDWYLYFPKLKGEAREAFIQQMTEIDPITHISNISPASVFFQFATDDFHVPKERAEEFFTAAKEPKEMKWYESGHGLNEEATRDRKKWLKEKLNLS